MASETWLDVMPAIPLARAVPVLWSRPSTTTRVRGIVHGADIDGTGRKTGLYLVEHTRGSDLLAPTDCRVDLDDPQGFAYALREAVRLEAVIKPREISDNIVIRHMQGRTTDTDRLALATALRAVVTP